MTTIIEIAQHENGSHRNLTTESAIAPADWGEYAVIPEEMVIPASFPFVDIEVTGGIVTSMTELPVPAVEPTPPTEIEQLRADVDFLSAMTGVSL